MKKSYSKALSITAMSLVATVAAQAQGDWGFQCIDPNNNTPRSTNHAVNGVGNLVFRCHVGISGTVTYGGGQNNSGPCYIPATTNNLAGRIGFMMGNLGSVQDENPADPNNAGFRDDLMVLTVGMPFDPSGTYGYATINVDGTRTLFGSTGFSLAFVGASDRYWVCQSTVAGVFVDLRCDVVADAARLRWRLTNTLAGPTNNIGLWFGQDIGMLTANGETDINGASQSGSGLAGLGFNGQKPVFMSFPNRRPPLTENRITRTLDPSNYPPYVDFLFGQTSPFGMRYLLSQDASTLTENGTVDPNFTSSDTSEIVYGDKVFITGQPGTDGIFTDSPLLDTFFLGNASYLAKYAEESVATGGTRTIIQYVKSPWGVGSYAGAYAAAVDAPLLVANNPNGQAGLSPNPMTLRVYVDNTGGYSSAETGTPIQDVKITLTLPAGLSLAAGEQANKTITTIGPRQMSFVDYQIEADGDVYGDLQYNVKIDPAGTPPTKNIKGIVRIASTPKIPIGADANLITIPWTVQDSAFNTILAPLQQPVDFNCWAWDPQTLSYVSATSAERGKGFWLISENNQGIVDIGGNPQTPPDSATGAPLISLKQGWNLIGNPFNYAIPVAQIVGVTDVQNLTWAQMLAQSVISGAVVGYDNDTQDYVYNQDAQALLQPNKGYWIYAFQDVDFDYSAVYAPGLPGSSRSILPGSGWQQNDKQWRLKLSARTAKSLDAENYIGVAKTAGDAKRFSAVEAPISPIHNVSLFVDQTLNGRATSMSHAMVDANAKKEWKVLVRATEPGEVTLSWPNISTIPKNTRFRMTDLATGSVRDLKGSSSYTFNMPSAGAREFKFEALPAGAANAVIGNVVVTQSSRAVGSPIEINYTLSAAATTTVRILSGKGREVFTVTRGRSDNAGQNTASWNLRDSANRLVAPGTYRVEVLAETDSGERVRRVVPVNVIR